MISSNEQHSSKECCLIDFNEDGSDTFESDEQFLNAELFIVSIDDGISISFSNEQSSNVDSSIDVIDDASEMCSSDEHF